MANKPPFVTVVNNNYDEAEFILRYKVIPPTIKKNESRKLFNKNSQCPTAKNSCNQSIQSSSKNSSVKSKKSGKSSKRSQNSNDSGHKTKKEKNADDIYYRLNGIDDFLRI